MFKDFQFELIAGSYVQPDAMHSTACQACLCLVGM